MPSPARNVYNFVVGDKVILNYLLFLPNYLFFRCPFKSKFSHSEHLWLSINGHTAYHPFHHFKRQFLKNFRSGCLQHKRNVLSNIHVPNLSGFSWALVTDESIRTCSFIDYNKLWIFVHKHSAINVLRRIAMQVGKII